MCGQCVEWGGKRWHRYGSGYYERTDKSVRPKRTVRLHVAVWTAAHGAPPQGYHVHHRDHDRSNNALGNLECLPNGDHQRHHWIGRDPIPQRDWATVPDVVVECSDCGAPLRRKRVTAAVACRRCQQRRADRKRSSAEKQCACCGAAFRTRAGNYCSQRCVNLATRGATVRVLPEGRRRT